ncbi:MAG TPA: hypothetical protein VJ242_04285 [Patescibacteria group bacterium]|nr:hypothetical protein [Patescibacteria group bacterium]
MTKEIQGPEQQQLSGQLKLSAENAVQKHIAQFWNPQNHPSPQEEERGMAIMKIAEISTAYPWGKRYEIAEAICNIEDASTIRGVRRAASLAYSKGAKGTPLQSLVQEIVRKRKAEIRKPQPPSNLGRSWYYSPW